MVNLNSNPAPAVPRSAPAGAAARPFASARFVVCAALLVIAAVGLPGLMKVLGLNLTKLPVPLKAPLYSADATRLEPAYVKHDYQPPPPSEEMLHTLGTQEFLDWRLVDTARPDSDPAKVVEVVVTYYTGGPDMVPHVPTECMAASGYDLMGGESDEVVKVPGLDLPNDELKVRLAQFAAPHSGRVDAAASAQVTILYLFHSCGDFCTTRPQVRAKLADPFKRHSYFSKVEMKFTDMSLRRSADRAEALAALPGFLQKFLPILLNEHFSWKEVNQTPPASSARES